MRDDKQKTGNRTEERRCTPNRETQCIHSKYYNRQAGNAEALETQHTHPNLRPCNPKTDRADSEMKLCWTHGALHEQRQSLELCRLPNDQRQNPNDRCTEKFLSQNRQHFDLLKRDPFTLLLPLFYSSRREAVTIRYIAFTPWFSRLFLPTPSAHLPADL